MQTLTDKKQKTKPNMDDQLLLPRNFVIQAVLTVSY